MLSGDAVTGVGKLNPPVVIPTGIHLDPELTACWHSVQRIVQEIDEYLFDLIVVHAHDHRGLRIVLDDPYRGVIGDAPQERDRFPEGLQEITRLHPGRTLSRKIQQVPDDLPHPQGFLLHHAELLTRLLGHFQGLQQVARVSQNTGRRVIDLMRNVRRQLTDGRHLGGMHELLLGAAQLVDLVLQVGIEEGILQGSTRQVREHGEQAEVLFVKDVPAFLVHDRENGHQGVR